MFGSFSVTAEDEDASRSRSAAHVGGGTYGVVVWKSCELVGTGPAVVSTGVVVVGALAGADVARGSDVVVVGVVRGVVVEVGDVDGGSKLPTQRRRKASTDTVPSTPADDTVTMMPGRR